MAVTPFMYIFIQHASLGGMVDGESTL